jgi:hypothetical protein
VNLLCGFLHALDELNWRDITEGLMRPHIGARAPGVGVDSEQLG